MFICTYQRVNYYFSLNQWRIQMFAKTTLRCCCYLCITVNYNSYLIYKVLNNTRLKTVSVQIKDIAIGITADNDDTFMLRLKSKISFHSGYM